MCVLCIKISIFNFEFCQIEPMSPLLHGNLLSHSNPFLNDLVSVFKPNPNDPYRGRAINRIEVSD